MRSNKNDLIAKIGGICAVLVLGAFIGLRINDVSLKNIQGYLLYGYGNSTDGNATSGNATDCNATDGNATSGDGSYYNPYEYYNEINLYDVDYSADLTVKQGDKFNIYFLTYGSSLRSATVTFTGVNGGMFSTKLISTGSESYVIIPENVSPDTYYLNQLLLIGENFDGTTFTKVYNSYYYVLDNLFIKVDKKETVKNEEPVKEKTKLEMSSLTFNSNEVYSGDSVSFTIKTTDTLKTMKLVFKNGNSTINISAKNLEKNPYFIIPSDSEAGNYILSSVILESSDDSIAYTNSKNNNYFNFNYTVNVKNWVNDEVLNYNNSTLNSTEFKKASVSTTNKEINIDSSDNPIIREEIFAIIKGLDKKLTITYNDNELVFNAKEITKSKSLDTSITTEKVSSNEEISKNVASGIIVNFADNGTLPSDATVRIKNKILVQTELSNKKVYVYFYNEEESKYVLIASNVEMKDDYYEFKISHNSKYILTTQKISDEITTTDEGKVVTFQSGKKVYLLLIGIAIILIIIVTVILVVNKNKKTVKKENDEMK